MISLEELCHEKPGLSMVLFVKTDVNCPENKDISGGNSDVTGISDEGTLEERQSMSERSDLYLEALSYLENGLAEQFDLDLFDDETDGVDQKLVSTGYLIKRYQKAADIIQSEIGCLESEKSQLQAKADIFKKQITRTKDRLQKAMQIYGKAHIETPLVSMKMVKNLPDICVDPDVDFTALEESPYIETKRTINKPKIIHDLKKGKVIPGFRLIHQPPTVRII